MAKNFIQPGKVVTIAAPTGGTTTGVGVLVGTLFGVALQTKAAAADVDVAVTGVWDLAKLNTQVWAVGDKIYWDNTNARADNAATAGMRYIGTATAAAANPTTTGKVRLEGTAALLDDDAGPDPASIATAGAATYTAAQILGGIIVRDPAGAARTDTFPTAALLVAALPGARVGDIIRCLIVNGSDGVDAAEIITLAAGTGGSFDTNQTAASREINNPGSKLVHVRLTDVTASSEAYVIYA